jgi:hypothetical protein
MSGRSAHRLDYTGIACRIPLSSAMGRLIMLNADEIPCVSHLAQVGDTPMPGAMDRRGQRSGGTSLWTSVAHRPSDAECAPRR